MVLVVIVVILVIMVITVITVILVIKVNIVIVIVILIIQKKFLKTSLIILSNFIICGLSLSRIVSSKS
jgi:hypothetical protein